MVIKDGKVLVRFLRKGRWAEDLMVSTEQFEVVPGQERMVSQSLGNSVVSSGNGEYVDLAKPDEPKPKKEPGPKPKNETGPVPKAEARELGFLKRR